MSDFEQMLLGDGRQSRRKSNSKRIEQDEDMQVKGTAIDFARAVNDFDINQIFID